MPWQYPDRRLPGETPEVTRWTWARKEELLNRIRRGEISEAYARVRWGFTAEELQTWCVRAQIHGRHGLLQTKIQIGRP